MDRGIDEGASRLVGATASSTVGDVGEADEVLGTTAELERNANRSVLSVRALVRALRPLQWTKNVVVAAALVFSGRLFEIDTLARSAVAIVVFCCVSSGTYLINDVRDAVGDRVHPTKRHRAIAAGLVTPAQALVAALVLFVVGFIVALLVRPPFAAVVVGYVALMMSYSYGLKRLVILDVFVIAAGFILRAVGGAVAIDVPVSPWLYVCTMLLALFIGFGKRRQELTSLEAEAVHHRASLDAYSVGLLDQIIGITASATVMAYSLYTFDAPTVPGNHSMMLTIPFVVYALFRYLFLIHRRDLGGAPEAVLFADLPFLGSIVGWGITSVIILYRF